MIVFGYAYLSHVLHVKREKMIRRLNPKFSLDTTMKKVLVSMDIKFIENQQWS